MGESLQGFSVISMFVLIIKYELYVDNCVETDQKYVDNCVDTDQKPDEIRICSVFKKEKSGLSKTIVKLLLTHETF